MQGVVLTQEVIDNAARCAALAGAEECAVCLNMEGELVFLPVPQDYTRSIILIAWVNKVANVCYVSGAWERLTEVRS